MNNWELGILRLYYVLWFVWTVLCLFAVRVELLNRDHVNLGSVAYALLFTFLVPPAFMYTVRWVYRGFKPKPSGP